MTREAGSAMRADVLALAERVKKATGEDREIDVRLQAYAEGRTLRIGDSFLGPDSLLAKNTRPPHDECVVGRWLDGRFYTAGQAPPVPSYTSPVPSYTSSIDAALALVKLAAPTFWLRELRGTAPGYSQAFTVSLWNNETDMVDLAAFRTAHGVGLTIPLAILAALLEAISSQETP